VLLSSLKWAIAVERTATRPGLPKHAAGLAAYEEWAKAVALDADYPKDDPKILEDRHLILADQAIMVEERGNAARFLRQMADAAPEAAETIAAAADLYAQVASEAGPVCPYGSGCPSPNLADPALRAEIIAHIRVAAQKEAKTVGYLEKVVATMEAASTEKEQNSALANSEFVIGPLRVQTLQGFRYAYVSGKTTDGRVAEAIHELELKLGAVKMEGPGLVTYRPGAKPGDLLLEVGARVAADAEPAGEVKIRWLPPFRCASVLYTGSTRNLGEAIGQLEQAMKEQGLESTGEYRELYLYWEDDQSPNNVMLLQWGLQD
jgi:effector-binding domain-containing protein